MEHAVDTFNCKAENCSRREPRACDSHNTLGIFLDEQGKCVHYEKVRRIDFEEMAQREKQCILLSKLIALSRKDLQEHDNNEKRHSCIPNLNSSIGLKLFILDGTVGRRDLRGKVVYYYNTVWYIEV